MIVTLAVLLPLCLAALFLFVRLRPRVDVSRRRAMFAFDAIVVLIAVLACRSVTLHFRRTTGESVDRAWWPILATLSSVFLASATLLVGLLVRNVVLFRSTKNGQ